MTTKGKLTDEYLEDRAQFDTSVGAMARELLAHRRASQAAPAPSGFGMYGEYAPITVGAGTAVNIPAPSYGLRVPKTLTDAQITDACMSHRHDYGLMIGDEKEGVRREAAEWWRCFEKTLNDPPAHLRAALSTPTEERQ